MSDPRQPRRACDRCHGQKLKCRRDSASNSEDCHRCIRAKAICIYSPAQPRSTVRYRARSSVQHEDPADGLDNDESAQQGLLNSDRQLAQEPSSNLRFLPGLDVDLDRPMLFPNGALTSMSATSSQNIISQDPGSSTASTSPQDVVLSGNENTASQATYKPDYYNLNSNPLSTMDWVDTTAPFLSPYEVRSSTHAQPPPLLSGLSSLTNGPNIARTQITSQSSPRSSPGAYTAAITAVRRIQDGTPASDTSSTHPQDLSDLVKQLSDLNARLHRHMVSVPPVNAWKPSLIQPLHSPLAGSTPEFALDQTFSLSQELAEILVQIFPGSSRTLDLDAPSELLILTSYLYLVEIYDKILRHMQVCAQAHQNLEAPQVEARQPLRLPTLSVGAFAISSSSPNMAVVLVLLMQAMVVRVQAIINEVGRRTRGNTPEGESCAGNITKVTREAIREKEQSMISRLGTVTQLALQAGVQ
ncbi:hypothetical protein FHL15_005502 [Xylaria flabelliformis]|uniref:Zn(2)-C6 fungal-type domain-containing protein n=1 Tax=Xylaria flabelliformis TaxID=2512241 RepID=A0A553HZZ8_9PEZI|nr:hypothetical protein FHL15_005502 [Xylaria flabelliformis]